MSIQNSRRQFLKIFSTTGLFLGLSHWSGCSKSHKALKILVLGGTNFVGPAIVNAALEKGHQVTLFNLGITNPQLFPKLELIKGDREQGIGVYEPLKKTHWDAVIDVWPEKAGLVDEAARALKNQTDHYVFISSIAVYRDFQEVGLNEDSAVVEPGPDPEEWYYPEEKIVAEQKVAERYPEKYTILRPGPIKGWRDPALDLLYWLVKLKRNESILAPGTGKDPLQFIDVKALGAFVIKALEENITGVYNCTGPERETLYWDEFLNLAGEHLGSDSELYWAEEDFLRTNKVRSFEDLPLWAPLSEDRGFMQISMEKANSAGFQYRPITETIDDCLNWFEKEYNGDLAFGAGDYPVGLERSRELELIEQLNKR